MTADFARGVEAALALVQTKLREASEDAVSLRQDGNEIAAKGAAWSAAALSEAAAAIKSGLLKTPPPAPDLAAVEEAIDAYGYARYEDGAAGERGHCGPCDDSVKARAALVAAIRAEATSPVDLSALRAAVAVYYKMDPRENGEQQSAILVAALELFPDDATLAEAPRAAADGCDHDDETREDCRFCEQPFCDDCFHEGCAENDGGPHGRGALTHEESEAENATTDAERGGR